MAPSPASTLVFLVAHLVSLSVPCRSLPAAVPPKPTRPAPAVAPKSVLPPLAAAPKPARPAPAVSPRPVLPGPAMAPKAVLPPAPGEAMPPAPWEMPSYGAKPVPEPVRKACVRTPFPDLCARSLAFCVDPKRADDMRRLAEASTRVAIEVGTALAAFGYVHAAGAKNGTRLRMCVRDCTARVDAAVKSLNASQAALRRGALAEAAPLLRDSARGFGACWGSCARFTGEVMDVMQKRARQFEKLIMIASAIFLMII